MSLTNKVAQFDIDSDLVNNWVHGPASGVGSTITTDSGVVDTPAKVIFDQTTRITNETSGVVAEAAGHAALALSYLTAFRATSYGALASDPVVDPVGNAPTVGDEYFNTTYNYMKRYNGTTWQVGEINTATLATPAAASLVGYMPDGVGAVATTVKEALRDSVSITRFIPAGINTETTNCSGYINAAIAYAYSARKKIYSPGGKYLCNETIDVGINTFTGDGAWNEGGLTGTLFIAGTVGMTVFKTDAIGRLSNLAIQGNNKANYGVRCGNGPRQHLENIEVYRCRVASYLLAKTQNGVFINCSSQYSVGFMVLANGARNNNFYSCGGGALETYYDAAAIGTPWVNTFNIKFAIDESNADYGGAGVTMFGQDRNNWFGGIYEYSKTGIVTELIGSFAGAQAVSNNFYGVEFTSEVILNASSGNGGTLLFDSPALIWKDSASPFNIGTNARITFKGEPFFSGGASLPNRGITVPSNYVNLFCIDTDNYYGGFDNSATSTAFDAATGEFLVTGGNSVSGVTVKHAYKGNLGDSVAVLTMGKPQGFSATLHFTIKTITGANPILVYIPLNGAPWRRQVASVAAAGTYSIPLRIGDNSLDAFQVLFANNSNTSFVVKGVVMRAAASV